METRAADQLSGGSTTANLRIATQGDAGVGAAALEEPAGRATRARENGGPPSGPGQQAEDPEVARVAGTVTVLPRAGLSSRQQSLG